MGRSWNNIGYVSRYTGEIVFLSQKQAEANMREAGIKTPICKCGESAIPVLDDEDLAPYCFTCSKRLP